MNTAYLMPLSSSTMLHIDAQADKACALMQGQFSCNVSTEILKQHSPLGSCCTPQGRALANFRVFCHQDHYYLNLEHSSADILINYLNKFAPFYQAKLSITSEIKVYGLLIPDLKPDILTLETNQVLQQDNILIVKTPYQQTSFELYGDDQSIKNWQQAFCQHNDIDHKILTNQALWQQNQIESGFCQIPGVLSEKLLPHDLAFEKTGLIDFNKGCFSGQEIIARMHYRGTPKRTAFTLVWQGVAAQAGDEILDQDGKKIGVIVQSIQTEAEKNIGLASLNIEKATQGEPLFIQNQQVSNINAIANRVNSPPHQS